MPIAGFDPSLTHFGWVILDDDKEGKDALLEYNTFRTDPSEGLLIQRLIKQRERVRRLLKDKNIWFVSMEAPILQDWSTELLFALNQFLHEVFLDLGIYLIYIQPLSLKKLAIPGMNPSDATKNHMIHAAKTELEKHGRRFSEHVSDAYFAAKTGSRFFNWNFKKKIKDKDLSPEEWNLFCGKHTFTRGKKKGYTEYKGIIYRINDQFFDYRKIKSRTISIKRGVRYE